MGTSFPSDSTTMSTSVPARVPQKDTLGASPRWVEDFTISESTAVSMMAPPRGPEAACAASLRPARWHSVPTSVK